MKSISTNLSVAATTWLRGQRPLASRVARGKSIAREHGTFSAWAMTARIASRAVLVIACRCITSALGAVERACLRAQRGDIEGVG